MLSLIMGTSKVISLDIKYKHIRKAKLQDFYNYELLRFC